VSVAERASDAWYAFLGRIRHPDAEHVRVGSRGDFGEFRGHKHCLVVTYRRSGEAVPTPVWFGLADGRVYFRTEERAGKTRRIRANGRVLVAACDNRGKPLGQAVAGHARIVLREDEPHAESVIQANFGVGRHLYESVAMNLGPKGVYIEVTPTDGDSFSDSERKSTQEGA
jgi:PPOX class probable F420-dependent enzyme